MLKGRMNGMLWLSHVYWLCLTYRQRMPYITLIVTKISGTNSFTLHQRRSSNKKPKLGRPTNVKKTQRISRCSWIFGKLWWWDNYNGQIISHNETENWAKWRWCLYQELKRLLIEHYGDEVSWVTSNQLSDWPEDEDLNNPQVLFGCYLDQHVLKYTRQCRRSQVSKTQMKRLSTEISHRLEWSVIIKTLSPCWIIY